MFLVLQFCFCIEPVKTKDHISTESSGDASCRCTSRHTCQGECQKTAFVRLQMGWIRISDSFLVLAEKMRDDHKPGEHADLLNTKNSNLKHTPRLIKYFSYYGGLDSQLPRQTELFYISTPANAWKTVMRVGGNPLAQSGLAKGSKNGQKLSLPLCERKYLLLSRVLVWIQTNIYIPHPEFFLLLLLLWNFQSSLNSIQQLKHPQTIINKVIKQQRRW